jgi:hypothetical protein
MVNAHWHPFFWDPPLLLVVTQVFNFPFYIALPLLSKRFFFKIIPFVNTKKLYVLSSRQKIIIITATQQFKKTQITLQQNNVV